MLRINQGKIVCQLGSGGKSAALSVISFNLAEVKRIARQIETDLCVDALTHFARNHAGERSGACRRLARLVCRTHFRPVRVLNFRHIPTQSHQADADSVVVSDIHGGLFAADKRPVIWLAVLIVCNYVRINGDVFRFWRGPTEYAAIPLETGWRSELFGRLYITPGIRFCKIAIIQISVIGILNFKIIISAVQMVTFQVFRSEVHPIAVEQAANVIPILMT